MSESTPKNLVLNKTLATFFPEGEATVEVKINGGLVKFASGETTGSFSSVSSQIDVDGTLVNVHTGTFSVKLKDGVILSMQPVVEKSVANEKAARPPKAQRSGCDTPAAHKTAWD